MSKLTAKEVDSVLQLNDRYAGAYDGEWDTDYDPHDDMQTTINIGVPEKGCGWGCFAPVAEVSGFDIEDGADADLANLNLLVDAKLNAAIIQRILVIFNEADTTSPDVAVSKIQALIQENYRTEA